MAIPIRSKEQGAFDSHFSQFALNAMNQSSFSSDLKRFIFYVCWDSEQFTKYTEEHLLPEFTSPVEKAIADLVIIWRCIAQDRTILPEGWQNLNRFFACNGTFLNSPLIGKQLSLVKVQPPQKVLGQSFVDGRHIDFWLVLAGSGFMEIAVNNKHSFLTNSNKPDANGTYAGQLAVCFGAEAIKQFIRGAGKFRRSLQDGTTIQQLAEKYDNQDKASGKRTEGTRKDALYTATYLPENSVLSRRDLRPHA